MIPNRTVFEKKANPNTYKLKRELFLYRINHRARSHSYSLSLTVRSYRDYSDRQEQRRMAPRERQQATEADWLRKERDSR
jgi:hypothetical protein